MTWSGCVLKRDGNNYIFCPQETVQKDTEGIYLFWKHLKVARHVNSKTPLPLLKKT